LFLPIASAKIVHTMLITLSSPASPVVFVQVSDRWASYELEVKRRRRIFPKTSEWLLVKKVALLRWKSRDDKWR